MALIDTGKDIQVIIGTGVPRASDMVYGGIAIDENGKIYTKNKNGSVVVVGEVNKTVFTELQMGSGVEDNWDGCVYNEKENTFTWTSDQAKDASDPVFKFGKSFRPEWRIRKLEFACAKVVKVSSNYTSHDFETVLVDVRSHAIVIKLPSSPSTYDRVRIVDLYRKAGTNKIVIDRNGKTIHKASANDSIECDGGSVTYEYLDSTWVVVS